MPVCAADSPLAFAPTFDRSTLKPAYGGYSVGELDFLAKRRLSMAIELLARPTCLHISLCVCVCVLSAHQTHTDMSRLAVRRCSSNARPTARTLRAVSSLVCFSFRVIARSFRFFRTACSLWAAPSGTFEVRFRTRKSPHSMLVRCLFFSVFVSDLLTRVAGNDRERRQPSIWCRVALRRFSPVLSRRR